MRNAAPPMQFIAVASGGARIIYIFIPGPIFFSERMEVIILAYVCPPQAQSDANVAALLKWKERLGAELWREVYVVIPTVWPVASQNPRLELFRNLLDEDQVSDIKMFMCTKPNSNKEKQIYTKRDKLLP